MFIPIHISPLQQVGIALASINARFHGHCPDVTRLLDSLRSMLSSAAEGIGKALHGMPQTLFQHRAALAHFTLYLVMINQTSQIRMMHRMSTECDPATFFHLSHLFP